MNNEKTYIITAPVDYVYGYLRYGHKELTITCTPEQLQDYLKDPKTLLEDAELIVDNYRIEDYGDVDYANMEVTEI